MWQAKLIENYITNSRWPPSISVKCIMSVSCCSPGDALRELDSSGLIRSDPFILLSGDVISNVNLKSAILFHREKRKGDPDAILTMCLKPVKYSDNLRPACDDLFVGLDSKTSRVLLFDNEMERDNISLPLEIINNHPLIDFRYDFLDCHIDICSPEVLLQFSDNFDYLDIRKDFVRNEVINWDLGMHIYGFVIHDEYAARVDDPYVYNQISRDVITRWVHPVVPDSLLQCSNEYQHMKRYVYRGKDIVLDKSVVLGECIVLGNKCAFGKNVTIDKATIGNDCIIGENSMVIDSQIWNST